MKATGYKDIHGNEICVGMICSDEINQVDEIEILEADGQYYAKPTGLDAELLSSVHEGLIIKSHEINQEVESMEALKCRSCKKELTADMEVEYSKFLTEFFCGPDCATDHYFDYMQSTPADLQNAEFLNDHEIKIVDGKLVVVEE